MRASPVSQKSRSNGLVIVAAAAAVGCSLAVGAIAIVLLKGSTGTTGQPIGILPESWQVADIKQQPAKILGQYRTNELAADAVYKGKLIAIVGTVNTVRAATSWDHGAAGYAVAHMENLGTSSVRCYFDPQDADEFKTIPKDSVVLYVGICDGKQNGHVVLRHCRVAKTAPIDGPKEPWMTDEWDWSKK